MRPADAAGGGSLAGGRTAPSRQAAPPYTLSEVCRQPDYGALSATEALRLWTVAYARTRYEAGRTVPQIARALGVGPEFVLDLLAEIAACVQCGGTEARLAAPIWRLCWDCERRRRGVDQALEDPNA